MNTREKFKNLIIRLTKDCPSLHSSKILKNIVTFEKVTYTLSLICGHSIYCDTLDNDIVLVKKVVPNKVYDICEWKILTEDYKNVHLYSKDKNGNYIITDDAVDKLYNLIK